MKSSINGNKNEKKNKWNLKNNKKFLKKRKELGLEKKFLKKVSINVEMKMKLRIKTMKIINFIKIGKNNKNKGKNMRKNLQKRC